MTTMGGAATNTTRAARRWLLQPQQATVAAVFDKRGNAIGLLRFLLAALVIVHHTRILGGFGSDPIQRFTHRQADLGIVAVAGFFALSGLLITRSAQHASLPRYLWHRVLRIMPGFWVCLIATAVVLGPVLWLSDHGSLHGYFGSTPSPVAYLTNNIALLINQTTIDHLLSANPYPRALNGSLWTLAYEFSWYLVVALLAAFGLLRRSWAAAVVLAVAVLSAATGWRPLDAIPVLGYAFSSRFAITFSFGILAYLLRDRLPIDDRLAVIAIAAIALTSRFGYFSSVGMIALAYALIWAAWRLPFRGFGAKHDLSYGVYIYGFPAQQTIAHFLPGIGYFGFMAASFLVVVPLARLSYSLVEAPALRFKNANASMRLVPAALHRRAAQPKAAEAPPSSLPVNPEPLPAEVPEPSPVEVPEPLPVEVLEASPAEGLAAG